jgi:hypothetical protein
MSNSSQNSLSLHQQHTLDPTPPTFSLTNSNPHYTQRLIALLQHRPGTRTHVRACAIECVQPMLAAKVTPVVIQIPCRIGTHRLRRRYQRLCAVVSERTARNIVLRGAYQAPGAAAVKRSARHAAVDFDVRIARVVAPNGEAGRGRHGRVGWAKWTRGQARLMVLT